MQTKGFKNRVLIHTSSGPIEAGGIPSVLCFGWRKMPDWSAMADEKKIDRVTLKELMVSMLATTDALAKLLIAKGIVTDEEIKIQLAKNGRIMWLC